jgi:hypothetical protein
MIISSLPCSSANLLQELFLRDDAFFMSNFSNTSV